MKFRYLLAIGFLASVWLAVPEVTAFGGTWETLYTGQQGLDCGGDPKDCYNDEYAY